jgi:hypothetical protein
MIKKALHLFFLPASPPFAETFRMNQKRLTRELIGGHDEATEIWRTFNISDFTLAKDKNQKKLNGRNNRSNDTAARQWHGRPGSRTVSAKQ